MSQRESQGETTRRQTSLSGADATPTRGVGALLRDARLRRGMTIADVAQNLRIRGAVLEAMEAGQFEKLPNGAYAVGFLRSYADFLGLDRDEIVRRVKAETAAIGARTELIFPIPVDESRLPSGIVVMVSILLAGGAYGLWYYHTAGERVAITRVDPVPEQLAPTNSPSKAEAATVVSPRTETPPPAVVASPPAAPLPVVAAPQLATLPPPTEPLRQFGDSAGSRIVIKATGDSWLQVRDAGGNIIFSRILRTGESYAAPDQPGQVFATGSAGMLDITVDGKKAPPVGRPGFIRRDVPLDPVRLLAGTAVVDPPPAASPALPAPAASPATRPEDRPSDS
jgi:cytoskeleton protein RodZ